MWFSLIAIALLVLNAGNVDSQSPLYTNCNDIPNAAINLTQFVLASPLKLLRSSDPSMTCTVGILTGQPPRCCSQSYGGYSFFLVQDDNVIYANAVNAVPDATGTLTTTCQAGYTNIYKFLPYDLTGPNPYLLAYLCGQTSGQVLLAVGYGRDESSAGTILDQQIAYYLSNVPGGNAVKDVWCGCPETPFCGGFFN